MCLPSPCPAHTYYHDVPMKHSEHTNHNCALPCSLETSRRPQRVQWIHHGVPGDRCALSETDPCALTILSTLPHFNLPHQTNQPASLEGLVTNGTELPSMPGGTKPTRNMPRSVGLNKDTTLCPRMGTVWPTATQGLQNQGVNCQGNYSRTCNSVNL